MDLQSQTSREYIRSLILVYFGLLTGQIVFAVITFAVNKQLMEPMAEDLRVVFIYIVPVFVINGFVTGQLIYRNRLRKIKRLDTLASKLGEYKSAFMIRLAMLEGAFLFAIIIYLLTADLIFMGMSGIIIAYFLVLRPTIDRISADMELNSTERMKLEREDEIIT